MQIPSRLAKVFRCFKELVKVGYFKICPAASWQEALRLAPKDAKKNYGTTIVLRPVSAATKIKQ